jgi:SRSO17 transposase
MTVILTFEIYQPKNRFKEGDIYRTKPEIAAQMIRELRARGFEFSLVLADSL